MLLLERQRYATANKSQVCFDASAARHSNDRIGALSLGKTAQPHSEYESSRGPASTVGHLISNVTCADPATLRAGTSSCHLQGAFLSIGVFSGMSNVLMLTGAFFMLQIYDRILPSRSVPTLVALAILVAVLFAALFILDMIRSRILVRIGALPDDTLSARVYDTIVRLPLKMGNRGDGVQPLRDLDAVRAFLSGPGPTALFDLPWLPPFRRTLQELFINPF